jgi:hypothetical protein
MPAGSILSLKIPLGIPLSNYTIIYLKRMKIA